jgi:hypothetical protein
LKILYQDRFGKSNVSFQKIFVEFQNFCALDCHFYGISLN